MEQKDLVHFMYMPLTGLGLYGGYRGDRWLKNRIHIFKQFVLPSLLNQTNKHFVLWVSLRYEERSSFIIQEFKEFLEGTGLKVVFTYDGVCFWDDKYPDEVARERLITAIHASIPELINVMGDAKHVLMTIQPSDDCYYDQAVQEIQSTFWKVPDLQVFGYQYGFVMDYATKEIRTWNPTTTPPFYTIKFPREIFIDPLKHVNYTGPYKSHEYVKDYLKAFYKPYRGFLVGTHGENISTVFNHPFARPLDNLASPTFVMRIFGIEKVEPLKLKISWRKSLMRRLPHGWQKKIRYIFGERGYAKFYAWIRS